MGKILISLLINCCIFGSAKAATYMYPFLNRAENVQGSAVYHFRMERITVPDAILDDPLSKYTTNAASTGSFELSYRRRCNASGSDASMCYLGFLGGADGIPSVKYHPTYDTVRSFFETVQSGFPSYFQATQAQDIKTEICYQFAAWGSSSNSAEQMPEREFLWRLINIPTSPAIVGGCVSPPPGNEWCAFDTSSIEFNFGSMTTQSNPITKSANVAIECTGDVAYKVTIRGLASLTHPDTIDLPNGLVATLSIDGHSLDDMLTGESGKENHTLEATLEGFSTATPGAFTHSEVLYITYS